MIGQNDSLGFLLLEDIFFQFKRVEINLPILLGANLTNGY